MPTEAYCTNMGVDPSDWECPQSKGGVWSIPIVGNPGRAGKFAITHVRPRLTLTMGTTSCILPHWSLNGGPHAPHST